MPGVFTHLGWVDVLHGHCLWSVSISGGGGVVIIVPLWGLASWAFVILKITVDMAHLQWFGGGAICGAPPPLLFFIVMVIVGVGIVGSGGKRKVVDCC